jgi:hypothetical protein
MNPSSPAVYNLNVNQGKLYDKTFTWKIGTTPVNITGYTAKLRAWNAKRTTFLSLSTTLDVNGNGIILGGSAGTVRLVIKTAKTATLPTANSSYELQLTRPDGEDIPFFAGGFYVTAETGDV